MLSNSPLGLTIGEALKRTVDRFGDREALVVPHQGYRATYAELWNDVTEVAKSLFALGVEKGDRVGIWAPSRFEWVLAQFATARIGATLVGINPASNAPELAAALKQSDARALLLAREFRGADFPAIFREVFRETHVRVPLVIDGEWARLLLKGRRISDDRLAAHERACRFDDPILAPALTHESLLNDANEVARRLGYSESDRVCIAVPLYHPFGMVTGVLATILDGATIVLPGEGFDPAAVLATVENERCTSLLGVPAMFRAVLESPYFSAHDVSSLRTGVMAGAPCPEDLLGRVRQSLHMSDVSVSAQLIDETGWMIDGLTPRTSGD